MKAKKKAYKRCKGEVTFSDLIHLIGQKHASLRPFIKNKGRLEMTSEKITQTKEQIHPRV